MSRAIVMSTLFLAALAAVGGYFLGKQSVSMDESTVIHSVIRSHLETHGGQAEDCIAVPGRDAVWIRVLCGTQNYDLDHRGQVIKLDGPST